MCTEIKDQVEMAKIYSTCARTVRGYDRCLLMEYQFMPHGIDTLRLLYQAPLAFLTSLDPNSMRTFVEPLGNLENIFA